MARKRCEGCGGFAAKDGWCKNCRPVPKIEIVSPPKKEGAKKGACLKCKKPILIITAKKQLFCGKCLRDLDQRVSAMQREQGKSTEGKTLML